ncbi:hypothetical protein jhhlp_007808 [Lomentospora prolificans]|uniref:Uncharacterized protein n=1 Tax=Lomentospora prolificans TaxID=41688 RepID=A0A2N3N0N3_9PEZI|nr:hypothetical protein jhhlp_007808 [Lomentospora prolificans]
MKVTSAVVLLGMLQAVLAQSLAPSPTESIGCQPHGDHWHCEAARPTEGGEAPVSSDAPAPAPTESAHSGEEEDHGHDAGASESLAPSPTESIGCEPHGDHWHCDGPRVTGSATDGTETPTGTDDDSASQTSSIVQVPTGAAAGLQIGNFVPVVAVAFLAQAAL